MGPEAARIRPAKAGDLPVIEAIVSAAYGPYEARIGVRPGPLDDDYAGPIAKGQVHVLEAEEPCGFVILIPQEDAMLLDNVAILPAAQGRGFGGMLMRFAEAQARAAGFACIRLYTHEKMVENRALYTRIGYVETGRKTERGLARVYFEKPL